MWLVKMSEEGRGNCGCEEVVESRRRLRIVAEVKRERKTKGEFYMREREREGEEGILKIGRAHV